jgi:hypothetical protein
MASFQRMIQEPKSKQNKLQQVYKLTVNHSLLSSSVVRDLHSVTQNTQASEAFNEVVNAVMQNRCFDFNLNNEQTETTNVDFVNESVNKRFVELKKIRGNKKQIRIDETDFKLKMQEAGL